MLGGLFTLDGASPIANTRPHYSNQVPPPEDLETMWEIGTWTWNWMEPPLGGELCTRQYAVVS